MFTGIIQATGKVAAREERGGDLRLSIDARTLAARVKPVRMATGESIAVNGTCLTVIACSEGVFMADVSRETLHRTTIGSLAVGSVVNLEAALLAGDPLGGHLVSGHVDGIAEVVVLLPDARSTRLTVQVPQELARYVAPKGSIALDGVSLTVNEVNGNQCSVNLVPHTLECTNLAQAHAGTRMNLEVDQLARYLERLLAVRQ